jgi:hypothetical protein
MSGPLLIAVDDLQWVDSASDRVIRFVLRRLDTEQIGFIATRRLERDDPACSPTVITAGNGFVEAGFGNVLDVRNEGATAVELYATYILPPGTTATGLFQPQPPNSNPACPFPS